LKAVSQPRDHPNPARPRHRHRRPVAESDLPGLTDDHAAGLGKLGYRRIDPR